MNYQFYIFVSFFSFLLILIFFLFYIVSHYFSISGPYIVLFFVVLFFKNVCVLFYISTFIDTHNGCFCCLYSLLILTISLQFFLKISHTLFSLWCFAGVLFLEKTIQVVLIAFRPQASAPSSYLIFCLVCVFLPWDQDTFTLPSKNI